MNSKIQMKSNHNTKIRDITKDLTMDSSGMHKITMEEQATTKLHMGNQDTIKMVPRIISSKIIRVIILQKGKH